MTPADSTLDLLTVHDVARRLNAPVWCHAKAEAGELSHLKLGRYLRFRASDVDAYLLSQRRASAQ